MINIVNDQSALLIVDMQYDFLPGGALAVEKGDEIIPVINALYEKFDNVILTQDWHPLKHISFASTHDNKKPFEEMEVSYGKQVLWPDHCVQGSHGASLSLQLQTEKAQLIIRKGFHPNIDSYSAFEEADRKTSTGLAGYLKERGIKSLFVVGLATDYCVAWTAMHGIKYGFEVSVVEDATKGIDLDGSLAKAWSAMSTLGIKRITSADIV